MIMARSKVAFLMSCEKFFATRKRAYFWTFTFPRVMPDHWYPNTWNRFMRKVQDVWPLVQGLRVVEIHPGGHGLHYHAIVDERLNVHIVRRLWKQCGGGYRIQAQTASRESAMYLAKYIAKSGQLGSGMRRWGCIGGFKGVRCKNLEIDSSFHRNFAVLCGKRRVPIQESRLIYSLSLLHGDIVDWPAEVCEQLKKALDNRGEA